MTCVPDWAPHLVVPIAGIIGYGWGKYTSLRDFSRVLER